MKKKKNDNNNNNNNNNLSSADSRLTSPASNLLKSILNRYRSYRNPIGPITVQYILSKSENVTLQNLITLVNL